MLLVCLLSDPPFPASAGLLPKKTPAETHPVQFFAMQDDQGLIWCKS